MDHYSDKSPEWEDADGLVVYDESVNDVDEDDDEFCLVLQEQDDKIVTSDSSLGGPVNAYRSISKVEDGLMKSSTSSVKEERILRNEFTWSQRLEWIWAQPLLPDNRFQLAQIRILDGPFVVKLFKFITITLLSIVIMFHLVRWVGWENDDELTISNIWVYEGNLIVMDTIVFFVVGRLHRQKGVDRLEFLTLVLLANIYSSYITTFSFLQHSFTLFEMHCRWPWALWLFVSVASILVVAVILLHVRRAVEERVFCLKLVELVVCTLLFLVPYLSSPYFHFHHWFAGWLLGMHCNFDVGWSRATMAWLWGCYINGIAVYGRDPVLTCGYAMYLSSSLHCPYLTCYMEGIRHPSNHTNVHPMIPPDWRNCSADAYHT